MCRIAGGWSSGSLDMLVFWQEVKIYTLISHNNERTPMWGEHIDHLLTVPRDDQCKAWVVAFTGDVCWHAAHPNTAANQDSAPFLLFTSASCVLRVAREFHVLDLFWHLPEMLDPTAILGTWRPGRFCGVPVCSIQLTEVNTVRETVSWQVVLVKKRLHDCQEPKFPRRTWQCNKMLMLL